MTRSFLCMMFLCTTVVARTQVMVQQIIPSEMEYALTSIIEKSEVIQMEKFNYEWIEREEFQDGSSDILYAIPPRFGYAYPVKIDNQNDGSWMHTNEATYWVLRIKSEGALSINLIFDEFYLDDGSELNIYNDSKTMKFGPVLSRHNNPKKKLSTDIIKGSEITLVLKEPRYSEVLKPSKSRLSIKYVIHGYATACDFGDANLNCHINAECSIADSLADEKYAVARILVHNGTRCCTGTLVNNTCNDFTPYFLTAFHCIDYDEDRELDQLEQDGIDNWQFSFKYISPNCSTSSEPSTWVSFSGASFVAANDDTDFLLVEMDDQPTGSTGLTYAGWSISDYFSFQNEGTSTLHHPQGDVMKYSADDDAPVANDDDVRFYYYYPSSYWDSEENTLWEIELDTGAIEGGSSGSPLFDPDNRIIGQAVGTSTQCPPQEAFYGRISESWDRSASSDEQLENWLDPDTTGDTITNTVKIPYISGPDFVCYSSNETFQLNNRPSGASVSWTYNTSLLTYVSGQGTDSFVVRASSSTIKGDGWVQAAITTGSCDPVNFRDEDFWVGRFNNTVVTGQVAVCPNTTYRYTAVVPFGSASDYTYSWTYPSNWTKISQSQNTVDLRTPASPDYGTVRVSITNDCGASSYSGITVYPGYCGGYYMAIPNPGSSFIDITVSNIDTKSLKSTNLENKLYAIKVFNSMGKLVYSNAQISLPFRLGTDNYPEGNYILQIIDRKNVESIKLVISH